MIHPIALLAILFGGMATSALVHGRFPQAGIYALVAFSMYLLWSRKGRR